MTRSRYVFDNAHSSNELRLNALQSAYDPATRRGLEGTGLAPGWHCLEIGGGGGSVGSWLAERVGPSGSVLVTDIDPRWMAKAAEDPARPPQLRVVQHDIVADPLPEAAFDLIHARLVLHHLPQRLEVLERLVPALRTQGWLVLEEFDAAWVEVLAAPDPESVVLFNTVHGRMLAEIGAHGADFRWGLRTYDALGRAGLGELRCTTFAEVWRGGTAEVDVIRANAAQLHDALLAAGTAPEELSAFSALLDDPRFAVNSYPLITTCGRRPA